MATREDEVRRKAQARRTANAALTPERPGIIARVGRAFGEKSAENRAASDVRKADAADRTAAARLRTQEAGHSFREGVSRLTEGFRAGSEGRPIDTSAFNPGEGTTDKTPRPPGSSGEGPAGIPLAPDNPQFQAVPQDQITVADSQPESDAFTPDIKPDIPAPTLANAGGGVIPTGGGDKGAPRPPEAANRFGQFEGGVPKGFINVIRGTTSRFLPVDEQGRAGAPTQEFAARPGQTIEESQRTSLRRDPAFNLQTQDDLAQKRINVQTMQAESERISALGNSVQYGLDDQGNTTAIVPDGRGGFRSIDGFTPVLDNVADDIGRFEFEVVQNGINQDVNVLDSTTGEVTNHSAVERKILGRKVFENAKKTEGGDLSTDEQIELLREVEAEIGSLPELEAAILGGQ